MTQRVIHLVDTGGPGGAETIFAKLVDRLDNERWSSVPVVPSSGWLEDTLRAKGHHPHVEPNDRPFDLGYLYRLVRLMRRESVDLVQTHLLGSSVYGGLAGRVCNLPVVATFHGTVDVSETDRLRKPKLRLLKQAASQIVFVSNALREDILSKAGLDAEKTAVIPNGVEVDRFSFAEAKGEFRSEIGARENEVLVGAVGNVRPAKDYGLLLRTAALLEDDPVPYRFVVVGEGHGEPLEELLSLRADLGLEQTVVFTGFREDIPRVLSDLDVYLLTSSSEGFSLSTVQALAAGVPVVATRCGGPEEIVTHGREGWLVDTGSPESVAKAIRYLVRNAAKARRLAEAGRKLVRREFSVETMVERYEALYQKCQYK